MKRLWFCSRVSLALCCFALLAPLAAAGDPQRYLTEDCDVYVHVNFKHMFKSDMLRKVIPVLADKYGDNLVKTIGQMNPQAAQLEAVWPMLKDALKDPEKVAEFFDAAGANFTDIIVVGNSKSDNDFLIVLHIPQLATPMVEMMSGMIDGQMPGMIKKEQEGGKTIYLMTPPDQDEITIAMTMLDDGVMGIALNKDRLKKAMKAKKGTPSAELASLLSQRMDDHTVFVAAKPIAGGDGPKQVTGFVRMDKDLVVDMKMTFENAEKAAEEVKEFNEGVENFSGMIKGLAGDNEDLGALLDLLKGFSAKASGSVMSVSGKVEGGKLLKLLKK